MYKDSDGKDTEKPVTVTDGSISAIVQNMERLKFSSLSAPTKIEELTAGSDEKTQRSPAGNRTQDLANSSHTL